MPRPDVPALFDCCRERIDELLDRHADVRTVERVIDDAEALDREEKDALWLWASGRRARLTGRASDSPIIGSTVRTEARDPQDNLRYPKGAGHD